MEPKTSYQRYLSKLHSERNIPHDLVKEMIFENIRKPVISVKPIIAGEVNEVLEINFSDKTQAILRISPQGFPTFQPENWAIKMAHKQNIPAPNIWQINYFSFNKKNYAFCLMEKIKGETLQRGRIDFTNLDVGVKEEYIRKAGEILSQIHSIETEGLGPLTENGQGQLANVESFFAELERQADSSPAVFAEVGLAGEINRTLKRLISNFRYKYKHVSPRLNHGDFFGKHFMVHKGQIKGIIDWGEVRSDSPVYDFANWSFWTSNDESLIWLRQGYGTQGLFDSEFDDMLHFNRLVIGLKNLDWYYRDGYEPYIQKAVARINEDIRYFK